MKSKTWGGKQFTQQYWPRVYKLLDDMGIPDDET